ncbi:MAG: nucleotidyltransferase family protein [Nitrospinae bacterium]|nr:nucleotidyltransferase family protein [Nitrospinota bacterium]
MNIELFTPQISGFCKRRDIKELAIFGSSVSGDFGPQSDVDILATFGTGSSWTFFDFVAMQDELEDLFGRKVDLASRKGLKSSKNHIRRQAILSTARVLYAA